MFIGASKEDAEEILKLNTFTFAGAALEVVESTEGLGQANKATESKETQELRAKLQSILSQRYIGANKLLKLDALSGDAELVTLGMFENRERALKTFKGLMAICDGLFKTAQEKRDAIESISLASNGIDDVSQVESVANTFPQLKNLDMSGNQITNMKGMERWKGKFKELETLYVAGNPIEADASFQGTLLEWFPKLQIINGTQLRTAEQIAQREEALKPKAIPQSGPDFRDVNGIGENFLVDFFTSYDNDRQGLVSRYYDEGSQFSLAVDTQSVRDANAPAPLPWAAYLKFSRNLIKITHQNARVQRLFKGAATIFDLWKTLPMTQHPNIKSDMSKYIMDCHPLPGLVDPSGQNPLGVDGLTISVHGEFDEYDSKSGTTGKRSFSRTFILGPGQPGRGQIRVVSDMVSLRAYGELPNVFAPQAQAPAPVPAPAPAPGSTPAPAAAPAGADQAQHQAMLAELCKQTGMVPQYSEMCLTQVAWDFDKALVMFNEKKVCGLYRSLFIMGRNMMLTCYTGTATTRGVCCRQAVAAQASLRATNIGKERLRGSTIRGGYIEMGIKQIEDCGGQGDKVFVMAQVLYYCLAFYSRSNFYFAGSILYLYEKRSLWFETIDLRIWAAFAWDFYDISLRL